MTRLGTCTFLLCLTACGPCRGADEKKESKTFADILTRVAYRDKDSGAILYVKMKEDAPPCGKQDLVFKMYERPGPGGDYVVINLGLQTITEETYEMYRLTIDNKIKEELGKLKLMEKQGIEKAKRLAEERAEKIKKATDGKLKYGMTKEEVETAWGEPKSVESGFMEAGRFSLKYERYRLEFRVTLFDLEESK